MENKTAIKDAPGCEDCMPQPGFGYFWGDIDFDTALQDELTRHRLILRIYEKGLRAPFAGALLEQFRREMLAAMCEAFAPRPAIPQGLLREIHSAMLDAIFYGHALVEIVPQQDPFSFHLFPREDILAREGILKTAPGSRGIPYREFPGYGSRLVELSPGNEPADRAACGDVRGSVLRQAAVFWERVLLPALERCGLNYSVSAFVP